MSSVTDSTADAPPLGTESTDARCATVALPATSLETRCGGVFYLVNLGIFLRLYGDFTAPARPGITLSIWDFVSLVGRAFFAGRNRTDPLWNLLHDLAGRAPGEPCEHEFQPADAWRCPREWVDPFSSGGTLRWCRYGGRLRIVHPAGFPLVDVPIDSGRDPETQLADELSIYEPVQCLPLRRDSLRPRVGRKPLRRWLDHVLPYVRARLSLALGVAPSHAELAPLLFEHQARVLTTTTRLDVVFSLQEHPIAIRLAGLDRDPGWVPAAGRVVAFHYR